MCENCRTAPDTERVVNMNTGETKEACASCGRTFIAIGAYAGPWWYERRTRVEHKVPEAVSGP